MNNFYAPTLLDACDRSGELFVVTDAEGGQSPRPKKRAKIPHPEWIPAELLRYADELNGCLSEWHSPDDGSGRPTCQGRFELFPLEEIYSDWSKELYLKAQPPDSRLHAFKIVDNAFADGLCVGLYHDEAQDPGLYVYQMGEGDPPYPLYLDFRGYVQLLTHSLGCADWQLALLRLLPDEPHNPANWLEDYRIGFREAMSAWMPEFDYDAFLALHEQVRLQDYVPSGLAR